MFTATEARPSVTPTTASPTGRARCAIDRAAMLVLLALCLGFTMAGAGCGASTAPTAASGGSASTLPRTGGATASEIGKQQVNQIDDAFKSQLRRANIVFSTPTKLRVGDSGLVHVRLSMHVPVDVLRAQLGDAGAQVGARILASNTMEATLTGLAFKIQDSSAATQLVGPDVTDWDWEIQPVRAGRLQLHLTMTAFLDVNGRQDDYGVRTFDRTLQVQSLPVLWYARLTHFLANNWVWIAGVIGFLGGAIRWLTRGRTQQIAPGAGHELREDADPQRANGRHHRSAIPSRRHRSDQPDQRSRGSGHPRSG
jgi:hypothetical protein